MELTVVLEELLHRVTTVDIAHEPHRSASNFTAP